VLCCEYITLSCCKIQRDGSYQNFSLTGFRLFISINLYQINVRKINICEKPVGGRPICKIFEGSENMKILLLRNM
jgi:hypothetical protein